MNSPTPRVRLDVDVTNPGHYFACCGLLELAGLMWPGAEGWFESRHFCLCFRGTLRELLTRLILDPPEEMTTIHGHTPVKPILAPLAFTFDGGASSRLVIDFWVRLIRHKGRVEAAGNPPWNLWSGQQTPARIWTPLRHSMRDILGTTSGSRLENLFELVRPLTGRFGFDSRAAWNAQDIGFSPNDQQMAVISAPAAELLAPIGIQRFRPAVSEDRSTISYATWKYPAEALLASAMSCFAINGYGTLYEARVISRGQYAALSSANPIVGDTSHANT